MKILHTSDWHLGQSFYDFDRSEEHRHFLRQLMVLTKEHQPDVLLVCGDVFDRINPTNEARNMYIDTLLALHDQNPDMTIVVTAGNHDNKTLLNLEGKVWNRLKVNVIGQVERKGDGSVNLDRHIVEVKKNDRKTIGFVVAVPHIFEQNYPQLDPDVPKEDRIKQFFNALQEKALERNPQQLPMVLSAHLAVTGGDFTGHDFQDMIGHIATVDRQWLGSAYDYIALGHIHGAQKVKDSQPLARYCGAPVPVSFDERGIHGVSLVTLETGQSPVVEHLPIENLKPLLTIPQKPAPFTEALEELQRIDPDIPAYIRLNILEDAPLPPNYREAVELALNDKKARFCALKRTSVKDKTVGDATENAILYDQDNIPDPMELAKMFYQQKYGNEMPEELNKRLAEAVRKTQLQDGDDD